MISGMGLIQRPSLSAALFGVLAMTALVPLGAAQGQIWMRQLGSSGDDTAMASAEDGAGGLYVTGFTTGAFGSERKGQRDAWLARFDDSGNLAWIHQFGSPKRDDALSVAADGKGGVYVCGLTHGSLRTKNKGLGDAWIAHFNYEGDRTWMTQIGTPGSDGAYTVASDGAGGVFVSGVTHGRIGGMHAGGGDVWLARYDDQGRLLWTEQFGTLVIDTNFAMSPDGKGGVFVAGDTGDSLDGHNAGDMDVWVARYNGMGKRIWIRQLGTKWGDFVKASAPDGEGGVYLSGKTFGSLASENAGGSDIWVARYDARGNQTWIRQFGTFAEEAGCGIALDVTGGAFVIGWSQGNVGGDQVLYNEDKDFWLARYDSAGNQSWIRQDGSIKQDNGRDVLSDGKGGFIVTGFTTGRLGTKSYGGRDAWIARYDGSLATNAFCDSLGLNSIQCQGAIYASGSNAVSGNELEMQADLLPPGSLGFIMHSSTYDSPEVPANGESPMCVGSTQSRIVRQCILQETNEAGRFTLPVDMTAAPNDLDNLPIQAGETWSFRAWYRDSRGAEAVENLTTIIAIQFH